MTQKQSVQNNLKPKIIFFELKGYPKEEIYWVIDSEMSDDERKIPNNIYFCYIAKGKELSNFIL